MNSPNPTIDILPDEVLATVLKLVADLPASSWEKLPFPMSASRVSPRWRIITLAYPELWATIRISRHSRSRKLAAMFVERSGSFPLDISISMESYVYKNGQPYVPTILSLSKVLLIVGPHVGRWRTIALRGWDTHIRDFRAFLRAPPAPASRLEYVHLSNLEQNGYASPVVGTLEIFGSEALHSLRLNNSMYMLGASVLSNLRRLDIMMPMFQSPLDPPFLQPLFGPTCRIATLIIRSFKPVPGLRRAINAPTLSSLALSLDPCSYYYSPWYGATDSIKGITETLSMPNLEYLEIMVGVQLDPPGDHIHVQNPWEEPPFPNLRTLRLEGVCITPRKLALLQILTREITNLELIYTTDNHHLLKSAHRTGGSAPPWPFLHSLTVESADYAPWIAAFVAQRAALGPNMALARLTSRAALPRSLAHASRRGVTYGLLDGLGRGFFVDEYDQRVVDFEYVKPWRLEEDEYDPDDLCWCDSDFCWCVICGRSTLTREHRERFEVELEEALRASVREKSLYKEAKKKKRKDNLNLVGGAKTRRATKRRALDIPKDFCVA
ncbi:hypothetical protein C8F04DRAFT_1390879 [Mycena alexandri]|uniref:F-box domain-containing protein n=1 Tax=Mycena alexandri TaxID=1745969 RepID=A0AAD6TDM9_9AGAR|nr:hypothetical protein C8F04DRAFT_1390879 [Mycena alexandri]